MTDGSVEPTDDRPSGRRRLGGLLVDPTPLRLDRDFRLLWIGQGISTVGRTFTLVAIPYQVYVLTGDFLAVGALSIVQLVATLIFALAVVPSPMPSIVASCSCSPSLVRPAAALRSSQSRSPRPHRCSRSTR